MNNTSPTSPLSLSNSSDGSSNHHDNVLTSANSAQPRELHVLNEIRSHHNSQPDPIRPTHYSNALKFSLRGNGSPQVYSPEHEFCPQLLISHPTGILPVGQTSSRHHKTQPDQPVHPDSHSSQLGELLTCCLIGKIWGDPIPISAIIHKTKKDWYFVKGQVD